MNLPFRPRCLALLLCLASGLSACGREAPRTVLLISLDTLRPDRLGAYGNAPDVSPHVDGLAARGVVFEQALANSPWTLPSHATMLSGLDPVAHGVKRADYTLSTRVSTLAEELRGAGFKCGAFTDGGFVSASFGLGQGFHVFDDKRALDGPNGMARILPRALDWLRKQRGEDVFLFVHTFDIHAPFQEGDEELHGRFRDRPTPGGPRDHELFRLEYMYQQQAMRVPEYGRMSALLNDYDAGIHEADRGVGALLAELEAQGRLDNALVIVTSDHGESLAEHGLHVGHGLGLTDDELHIPLIIKLPGDEAAGRRNATLVDLTDIMPTALDVLSLPIPEIVQGESLAGLVRGQPRRRDYMLGQSSNTECVVLVKGQYKFISPPSIPPLEVARRHLAPRTPAIYGLPEGEAYTLRSTSPGVPAELHYDILGDPLGIRDVLPETAQLFDRHNDPHERRNLYHEQPELTHLMASAALFLFERSLVIQDSLKDGIKPTPPNPHQVQQLIQLGYLSTEAEGADASALPRALREPLLDPYLPPDRRELEECDRYVHFVRMLLRDGRTPDAGTRAELQKTGERYMRWGLENPDHVAKVIWRIGELVQVGRDAGFELDQGRWNRSINETRKQLKGVDGEPPR